MQDYIAAGMQDSFTATTLKPHDFHNGHRGDMPSQAAMPADAVPVALADPSATPDCAIAADVRTLQVPDSAVDWGGPTSIGSPRRGAPQDGMLEGGEA